MLKKIMKSIRRQLLKVDWIKREVKAYRWEQKKQQNREHWAQLMRSGNTVHTHEDKPLLVNYSDSRMIGQRHVTPRVYNSDIWQELIGNQSSNNRDNDRSKLGLPENGSAGEPGVGPCEVD